MAKGKKLGIATISIMITLIFGVLSAQALTVTLTDPYPLPNYNGGPFLVTVIDPSPYNISSSVFDSFCLERNEYFNPGSTIYYGSIGDSAVAGGGGAIPGPINGQTYDPLDIRTQRLYDYYLDNQGSLSSDQKAAIQLAIWRIEQEVGNTYDGLLNGTIRGLADTYFNNADSYTLDRTIKVLNLYGASNLSYDSRKQSQLVQVPEPTTLYLLGLGLVGLGILGRKKFKR